LYQRNKYPPGVTGSEVRGMRGTRPAGTDRRYGYTYHSRGCAQRRRGAGSPTTAPAKGGPAGTRLRSCVPRPPLPTYTPPLGVRLPPFGRPNLSRSSHPGARTGKRLARTGSTSAYHGNALAGIRSASRGRGPGSPAPTLSQSQQGAEPTGSPHHDGVGGLPGMAVPGVKNGLRDDAPNLLLRWVSPARWDNVTRWKSTATQFDMAVYVKDVTRGSMQSKRKGRPYANVIGQDINRNHRRERVPAKYVRQGRKGIARWVSLHFNDGKPMDEDEWSGW